MTWTVWLIIVLVCIIIEFLTIDFSFLMLGGGALVAALISGMTDNLVIQIIGFSVSAIFLLLVVRPWIKKHFNPKGSKVGNVQSHVGRSAIALTDIDTSAGRVKIGGDVWSARTAQGSIPQGSSVVVSAIDGAQAVVSLAGDGSAIVSE
ncbi:MAG: NfeD family protein [Actinomycetaceae bacterium]|nr:NfeD family protein [Actinomycetaceae bacterium]